MTLLFVIYARSEGWTEASARSYASEMKGRGFEVESVSAGFPSDAERARILALVSRTERGDAMGVMSGRNGVVRLRVRSPGPVPPLPSPAPMGFCVALAGVSP